MVKARHRVPPLIWCRAKRVRYLSNNEALGRALFGFWEEDPVHELWMFFLHSIKRHKRSSDWPRDARMSRALSFPRNGPLGGGNSTG